VDLIIPASGRGIRMEISKPRTLSDTGLWKIRTDQRSTAKFVNRQLI